MLRKIKNKALLAGLSALLLVLSFPGFDVWILPWIAFIPLLFAVDGQRPLNAFLTGYAAGFLFFLGSMYWLMHVTLPGMLIVVAYLALYFGAFAAVANFYLRRTENSPRRIRYALLFALPATWASLEWIRAHALTGFGWNLLGYSQTNNLTAIQIADISGAYGVSFLIVMFNAAVYIFLKHFRHDEEAYVPVAMAVITMLVVFGYGAYRLNNAFTGEKLRVAIVQGSIPQAQKWDSNFAGMIMSRYEDLTKKSAEQKPDLVIWPETSIPGFVENEEELASRVKRLVQEIKTPLLAGSPRYEEANGADSYYNSAFLFLKDGSLGGRYDKLHLVPFGEYVPLRGLFFFVHKFAPRPIGDFTAGKDFTIFRISLERAIKNEDYSWKLVKKVTFSTLICFEDIFPELARNFAKKGASFLVNITNDGWFGRSAAAYQHAQASVFRAVENRINVLRAANTGLSCFIDQKGRITSRVKEDGKDLFVSGFVAADVVLSRAKTIYTVYGDIFAYACMVFTAVCLVLCYKNVGSVSHEA